MNNSSRGGVMPALSLREIARSYSQGHRHIDIFKDLSIDVFPGEVVALVGHSGTGKSSLLHIAGLLEKPTAGDVYIAGENCTLLSDGSATRVRRLGIGFVYQFHHLLPEFNAIENVIMPQLIAGVSRDEAHVRADELLNKLGLSKRATHRPAELSGGEQQRVAIARALANRPLLLLADEPTGNLDPETAGRVHNEFLSLIRDEGLAALIATHNIELAHQMNRVVQLHGGKLVEVTR
ncbi:MAG: ABC transporter ATP-binding protein [Anderseniella sp.]